MSQKSLQRMKHAQIEIVKKTYPNVCTLTQNDGVGTGKIQVTSGFHALMSVNLD